MELARTPSFRLDGKRALVTGGGRGIGLAAASALAQAGAHVTLAARTKAEIEAAAEAIRARGDKAEALVLDVTDVEAMRAAIAQAEPFDILVNNAGTNRPAFLMDVKVEDFDFIFALNVRAAFFVAQAVARRLIEAKQPARSSTSPRRWATSAPRGAPSTAPPSTPWRASPRRWRSSSRPHNIRVNSLGPTFLETPMTRPFFENEAFRDEVLCEDQARPPRPARGADRRDRVPGLRRLLADDRLGAGDRRRLDRGVTLRPQRRGRTCVSSCGLS